MISWNEIDLMDLIKMQQEAEDDDLDRQDEERPYFENDEDRCPRMGMQGMVLGPRRLPC